MAKTELTANPDIQGIFFRGYVKLDRAAYGFFRISDRIAFQRWMAQMLGDGLISSAADRQPDHGEENRMNIAFTAPGMQALLGEGYIADSYDHAFAAGIVGPQRNRILGDVDTNDPKHWDWGGKEPVHGVLMSFSTTTELANDCLLSALCKDNGATCTHTTFGHLEPDGREPFGFKDGVSQPVIDGTKRAEHLKTSNPKEASLSIVPAGELLLGYKDGTGTLPRTPATSAGLDPDGMLDPHPEWHEKRDLGKNGTYMVFRQLEQHTEAFWDYLKETATGEGDDTPEKLAEKMVGRGINGEGLAPGKHDTRETNNDFDFTDDREGRFCPIGSHVRRGNNRAVNIQSATKSLDVTLRHRILRRARIFKDDDGATGLQFLCFNASIVRQFEFVQSAWCNNSFFQGLQREVDPIIGTPRTPRLGAESVDRFTIPRSPYRRVLENLPQFVTVRGGGYFFMPGLQALRFIAQSGRAEEDLGNTPS